MKKLIAASCLAVLPLFPAHAGAIGTATEMETFLSRFDYEMREEMKTDSKELVRMLVADRAVLVDVRFPEEVAAWGTPYALKIPLNELPRRLQELPRNKTIVAACPHKDRSAIAMAYLRSKGYEAKYLTDGLIGLAEYLRGERAKEFVEAMARTGGTAAPRK